MPAAVPPFKRLLSGYEVDSATGCWLWNGSKYKNGYGWLKVFGAVVSAHRYSYELHNGPIPNGLEILHSCDVKECINPSHLIAGTHSQNMKDASARGLIRKGKDHPMYGKKNPRPKQSNRVLVLGLEYQSQKDAERSLGLGSGTVLYWIRNAPHKAQIIKKGELNE